MKVWQRWLVALPAFLLCAGATQWAMRGRHESTGNVGYLGTAAAGVEGTGGTAAIGVQGSSPFIGVLGVSNGLAAVRGETFSGTAIEGYVTASGTGRAARFVGDVQIAGELSATSGESVTVSGTSDTGFGVAGYTTSGTGVYGQDQGAADGHAGFFEGAVTINGSFTHNAPASLRIDHPLDPVNRYLYHRSVESPEMKNFYDGVVQLEADGSAVVELPEWFEALNKDFRYQLTCIGEHAPVYVAEEIKESRFRIAGGFAGMKVSWAVTGVRNDPWAQAYPQAVDAAKGPRETGRFVHPEVYGQPLSQRITVRSER